MRCEEIQTCRWIFNAIFAAISILVIAVGWSTYSGYQSTSQAQEIEYKLDTQTQLEKYIADQLKEIKQEQKEQRKLMAEILLHTKQKNVDLLWGKTK